jgi:hypothetical protein
MKRDEIDRIASKDGYTTRDAMDDTQSSLGDLWRTSKDHTKQDKRSN